MRIRVAISGMKCYLSFFSDYIYNRVFWIRVQQMLVTTITRAIHAGAGRLHSQNLAFFADKILCDFFNYEISGFSWVCGLYGFVTTNPSTKSAATIKFYFLFCVQWTGLK